MSTTRRDFLKTSVGAAAGLSFAPVASWAADQSPNETLRIAVIGTGGRGGLHISGFSEAKGARLVAICDADEKVVNSKAEIVEKKYKQNVDRETDYRKVLERDDVDAIAIASPNHWHALMTIQGCQAGKHVYTEKPVCHTIWEGRKMVEAMDKYDRIVAAGFQNRSDVGLRQAMPLIHDEKYGAIVEARGLCYRNRNTIGKLDSPAAPPSSVDYNLWLGPAADEPIMRPRFHYDWHWDFNTGNGDMGNQGPHEMDLLRWALGDPKHPEKILSFGGRFAWDDAGNTPNMQCAMFDFGNGIPVTFEVRNLHQKKQGDVGKFGRGPGVGIIVTCEKGEFRGGRGGGSFFDNDGNQVERFKGDAGKTHMQNFVDAVLTNKPDILRSPLESAFYSSSMSHLANISVLSGETASRQEIASELSAAKRTGAEVFDRFNSQLDLWNVDADNEPWTFGQELTFDADAEQFTSGGNIDKANGLIRREYRKGFEVPENV